MAFSYTLPESRIAQRPVHPADAAKLLIVDRTSRTLVEKTFADLPERLTPLDLLILNNSKVNPARLFGSLEGDLPCEIILEASIKAPHTWRAFGRPMRKLKPGAKIIFSEQLSATVSSVIDERGVSLEFDGKGDLISLIDAHGVMPIPPYIRGGKADAQDRIDYQTLFAEQAGSIAAPTASLHFTESLLRRLSEAGIKKSNVTLHVGVASIFPVENRPQSERFEVSESTCAEIQACKKRQGRVVAVGTTAVRAIESIGKMQSDKTDLFITPGYKFDLVDRVITNFHQPGTTHLLLVEALLGQELLEKAYSYALDHNFRFLSYGDAMMIID